MQNTTNTKKYEQKFDHAIWRLVKDWAAENKVKKIKKKSKIKIISSIKHELNAEERYR
jgi:hypothetical protein